ncbi:CBS domain-containing protein, partial [Saprospiraceae bacterium]|nr:CBS domain-containing protein [Saprospiraceae bacterium]
ILPKNVDFDLIDHFEKVSDKDGAVLARRLAKEEGLLLGYSAGSALGGILQMKDQLSEDDVVVVLFHDHGSRYIGKIYNDDWMKERGWLEVDLTVKNLINGKHSDNFISIDRTEKARAVLTLMKEHDLSQLPVVEGDEVHGSITQSALLEFILSNPMKNSNKAISEIMGNAFPIVDADMSVKELNKYISKSNPAVITKDESGKMHIITQYDIIQAL